MRVARRDVKRFFPRGNAADFARKKIGKIASENRGRRRRNRSDFNAIFRRRERRFSLYSARERTDNSRLIFRTISTEIMGNLKKKRRLKMNKHKRRKRSKANRHKKRIWG